MTPLRILSRDTDFAARNSLVGIEHLTDEELQDIRHKCEQRAKADQVRLRVKKTSKKARRAAERVVASE